MEIEYLKQRDTNWKFVLQNVRNEPAIVYALTLDAFFKWKNKGYDFSQLINILEKHKDLSSEKLEGITSALLEFQILNSIPKEVINKLTKAIEMRIFDDELGEEKKWINNAFTLLKDSMSESNIKWIISIINNPSRRMPNIYFDSLIEIIKTYIIDHAKDDDFQNYIRGEIKKNKKILLTNQNHVSSDNQKEDIRRNVLLLTTLCSGNIKNIIKYCCFFKIRTKIWRVITIINSNLPATIAFCGLIAVASGYLGFTLKGSVGESYARGLFAITALAVIVIAVILFNKFKSSQN